MLLLASLCLGCAGKQTLTREDPSILRAREFYQLLLREKGHCTIAPLDTNSRYVEFEKCIVSVFWYIQHFNLLEKLPEDEECVDGMIVLRFDDEIDVWTRGEGPQFACVQVIFSYITSQGEKKTILENVTGSPCPTDYSYSETGDAEYLWSLKGSYCTVALINKYKPKLLKSYIIGRGEGGLKCWIIFGW